MLGDDQPTERGLLRGGQRSISRHEHHHRPLHSAMLMTHCAAQTLVETATHGDSAGPAHRETQISIDSRRVEASGEDTVLGRGFALTDHQQR
ncbi:unnamed protein product [Heligmosomoides polygyrus]|uniref:Transposase n=1 Tax=Heligmosomoides polygyrus TaxID=6339 RepID=A0A183GQ74_HELPZ|nr:unnamed protein product [Heligmosomoides polygyrus]